MTRGDDRSKRRRAPAAGARELALDTLLRVEREGAYSNLELGRALQQAGLSRPDAALATELVYGTLQRQATLDYWLGRFVAKGLDRLEPWVRLLLRLSLYQLVYLDRVPDFAVVNEAVALARRRGHAGIAGMVNGVLRSALRRRGELVAPKGGAPAQRLAIAHSYPEWLVRRWIDTYGAEEAEAICAAGNRPPPSSIRVNLRRGTVEAVQRGLRESGIEAAPAGASPAGLIARGAGNLADRDGYREGRWSIQDIGSMLVAEAAEPQPDMEVLDCCAAPGGKSTHLAELMDDRGTVWANDLHPHKQRLIEQQAQRLGLTSVRAVCGDAAALGERFAPGSLDLVLLDAPCSGLGVIHRKPEVKWTKSPADVAELAKLQERLLDAAAPLVRVGGRLVYSTCTIAPEENERQVEAFLARHPDYALDPQWPEPLLAALRRAQALPERFAGMLQLLPQTFGSDGFFIARLTRKSR
ncbi:16S rRNA (cytosine(967)-C(5))-methyltransferase RsmB [Paenibacillus sp. IB182496]|uniref:16S rRNA (cytosine(967)-C(5))-methyltransferase n=1 Tax=Paenibacillus sabuli TaxID=2772509 RepID=A0A927BVK4_9BACL|nr:16S rRNA (cytosine(967)-C(5))-methyltransferase RsmB [Paenibacillus sabuli]MBD2846158.1 16S rRNA (cytosine(967)-C(5))-methyltransferase RsmB [Paenibacillus sabuli]